LFRGEVNPLISIPPHVMQPGDSVHYIPEEDCRPLKSAGLGYTLMKALGAHKGLSRDSIKIIQEWCKENREKYPHIVPDERKLKTASFDERLLRPSKSALMNAVCYPGLRSGKPSYKELYKMVWIEQRWPGLCRAMCNIP